MPRDPLDIDKLLALAKRSLADGVSGQELLKAILDEFGGATAIAKALREEFNKLAPGHPSRIKLLMLIISSMFRFGEEGGSTGDLEEAEKHLADLLKEAQETPQ